LPKFGISGQLLQSLHHNYIIRKLLTLFCEKTCVGFVVCSQELDLWRETCVVFGCLSHFVSLVVVVVVCFVCFFCFLLLGFFFFLLLMSFLFFDSAFFFPLLLVELQAHSPTPSPSINHVCILEEDLRILVSSKKKT
jgi:hypothetical protein